jgi:RNA polymerase sigma-70 factor, ECF subfamily
MSDVMESGPATLDFESHRSELTGYCYRMLGSTFDADDAVQETMVRAWQAADTFEGRSSVRSWLYRIATNVCLDGLRSRQRRALPMDLSAPVPSSTLPEKVQPETTWIEPIPAADVDPAEHAVAQDSIRLAFVAALQHLPPKQRAVLILREVLAWQATEVAELLETTVASVNSALQRARATLSEHDALESSRASALADEERALLGRYVAAFESYDIDGLVKLLHEDAGFSMPPFEMWIKGVDQIHGFYLGHGIACKDSRLVPVLANDRPAFGHYKRHEDGVYRPWAIQVIEISAGRIAHLHHFLDTNLFARFGLPPTLN